jgi:hypothetical protein
MLRITVRDEPESVTFQLEGRLAGPWVREAQKCWDETTGSHHHSAILCDLTGVTLIDHAGKAFLAAVHAQGAQFVASGCMMRCIVSELTRAPLGNLPCPEREAEVET